MHFPHYISAQCLGQNQAHAVVHNQLSIDSYCFIIYGDVEKLLLACTQPLHTVPRFIFYWVLYLLLRVLIYVFIYFEFPQPPLKPVTRPQCKFTKLPMFFLTIRTSFKQCGNKRPLSSRVDLFWPCSQHTTLTTAWLAVKGHLFPEGQWRPDPWELFRRRESRSGF